MPSLLEYSEILKNIPYVSKNDLTQKNPTHTKTANQIEQNRQTADQGESTHHKGMNNLRADRINSQTQIVQEIGAKNPRPRMPNERKPIIGSNNHMTNIKTIPKLHVYRLHSTMTTTLQDVSRNLPRTYRLTVKN
ncbi:hypothetical protein JTB14_000211 [Gonioctena quinquepunctata]|nr:hypothetical protein JTB14_000211 [Gonioctena quinquepunctata]